MNSGGTYSEIDDNLCPLFIGENPLMSKVLCKVQCVLDVYYPSQVSSVFQECWEEMKWNVLRGLVRKLIRIDVLQLEWRRRRTKEKKEKEEEEVLEEGHKSENHVPVQTSHKSFYGQNKWMTGGWWCFRWTKEKLFRDGHQPDWKFIIDSGQSQVLWVKPIMRVIIIIGRGGP